MEGMGYLLIGGQMTGIEISLGWLPRFLWKRSLGSSEPRWSWATWGASGSGVHLKLERMGDREEGDVECSSAARLLATKQMDIAFSRQLV